MQHRFHEVAECIQEGTDDQINSVYYAFAFYFVKSMALPTTFSFAIAILTSPGVGVSFLLYCIRNLMDIFRGVGQPVASFPVFAFAERVSVAVYIAEFAPG